MFPAEIADQPSTYLEHLGTIFTRFGPDTQDSGNISYGVQTGWRPEAGLVGDCGQDVGTLDI
jgi:serine/threonine-protein kinase